jgi:hypothetical protein
MGAKIERTYADCMEQHILILCVALRAYLGNFISDGDVVNVYSHAPSQGTIIFIAVNEFFQAWYLDRLKMRSLLALVFLFSRPCMVTLVPALGGPNVLMNNVPLHYTEPTIYRQYDDVVDDPTLMIRQVDDIMVSAASSTDHTVILNGIASDVTFKIPPGLTSLFYAMASSNS